MATKPGYKTSEFWLNAVLQVVFFLNTSHVWTYMPARWSALVQAIVAAAYMASRGMAKRPG